MVSLLDVNLPLYEALFTTQLRGRAERANIMVEFMHQFNPVTQALIATLFTWGVTAAGAAFVFITSTVNQKLLDSMLGFAAGVMIAASFWSLLASGYRNG